MLIRLCALLAAFGLAVPAAGQQFQLGTLVISHPWSRATAEGMPMGVAYLSITNNGKVAEALLAASSPVAARVEIHQTTIVDGMARMRPLPEVGIAPGATVQIGPGGIHLMLVDLKAPLTPGKTVPLTLDFRIAGRITVELSVEAREAPVR
jgi:periplasmic copper chaperone A